MVCARVLLVLFASGAYGLTSVDFCWSENCDNLVVVVCLLLTTVDYCWSDYSGLTSVV